MTVRTFGLSMPIPNATVATMTSVFPPIKSSCTSATVIGIKTRMVRRCPENVV